MASKVLLVEDDPNYRTVLALALELQGYLVRQVAGGMQAIEFLKCEQPDIIISDVIMPELSGLDLLRALKSDGMDCPVVLVTAQGSIDLAVEAMRRGARDFVQKPWENARLLAIAKTQVELRRALMRGQQLEAENRDYEFSVAEFKRQKELFQQGLISKSDFDSFDQKMRSAEVGKKALGAEVGVKEAEIEQNGRSIDKAKSAVVQAQAQYERAEENLRYASIRSPIGGVVLSREVEVGDAVSSILQLGSNATLIMTLGDVSK